VTHDGVLALLCEGFCTLAMSSPRQAKAEQTHDIQSKRLGHDLRSSVSSHRPSLGVVVEGGPRRSNSGAVGRRDGQLHSGYLWKLCKKTNDAQRMYFESWRQRYFAIVEKDGVVTLQYMSEKVNGLMERLALLYTPEDEESAAEVEEMPSILMQTLSDEDRAELCNSLHQYRVAFSVGHTFFCEEVPDTLHQLCISWNHPVDGVKHVVLAANSKPEANEWLDCLRKALGIVCNEVAGTALESVKEGRAPLLLPTPSVIWRSLKSPSQEHAQSSPSQVPLHASWGSTTPKESIDLLHEHLEDVGQRLRRNLCIPEYLANPHPRSKSASPRRGKSKSSPSRDTGMLLPTLKVSPWDPNATLSGQAAMRREKKRLGHGVDRADVLAPKKSGPQMIVPRQKQVAPIKTVRGSTLRSHSPSDTNSPRGNSFFSQQKRASCLVSKPEVLSVSTSEFDLCFRLARQYGLSPDQIKDRRKEFLELDLNNSGQLCRSEFEEAIRLRCKIPIDEDIPDHMLLRSWGLADRNESGSLDFEEYLLWSMSQEYSEEWLVADASQRAIRKVAREYNYNLVDVEAVKEVFDKFDVDKSGSIDEEEFRKCIYTLLGASQPSDIPDNKMKRFWVEIDTDKNGDVSLEEFVLWYFKMFVC